MSVRPRRAATDFGAIDSRWFEENPDRNYRIRQPVDRREAGMLGLTEIPRGRHGLIAVRQMRPGVRLRVAFLADQRAPDPATIGEDVAQFIFANMAGPSERRIADLMAAVGEGGGEGEGEVEVVVDDADTIDGEKDD